MAGTSHTYALPHSHPHSHTHTITHSHTPTRTHSHAHTLTYSHPHTHTHTHTHSFTHTLTHSLRLDGGGGSSGGVSVEVGRCSSRRPVMTKPLCHVAFRHEVPLRDTRRACSKHFWAKQPCRGTSPIRKRPPPIPLGP